MDIAKITRLVGLYQPNGWPQNISEVDVLDTIEASGESVSITLRLPFLTQDLQCELTSKLSPKLMLLKGVEAVSWVLIQDIATLSRCNEASAIKGVKNVIAVASGKGGVGKSTTSVNLALALSTLGASVGIMDADIYGPSIPLMLGKQDVKPEAYGDNQMRAVPAHGLAVNSIGFIALSDQAMIWRGPMASKALLQLLNETHWGELDYLIIDMPPGTGDIQLTLSQHIPVTGAVIVSTPQDVALADAAKGISMFRKVDVPVIGVVENMSMHICSQCGHEEAIFGNGGVIEMVKRFDTECIAQLPLHVDLCQDIDNGLPTVKARPESTITQHYLAMAESVSTKMFFEMDTISTEIPIKFN